MARSVTVAKTATPKPTGKVLQPVNPEQVPVSPEQPKAEKPTTAKAKRESTWRKTALPADTATILFNEAAYNAKPKRGKSQGRISHYVRGPKGMTVTEFRDAYTKAEYKGAKALANADLKWDLAHGFISVK